MFSRQLSLSPPMLGRVVVGVVGLTLASCSDGGANSSENATNSGSGGGSATDGGSGGTEGSSGGATNSGGTATGGSATGGSGTRGSGTGGSATGGSGTGGSGATGGTGVGGSGAAGSGGTGIGGSMASGGTSNSGSGGVGGTHQNSSAFAGYSVLSASIVDGSSTHWEQGRDVAFDSQGNIIIVGGTSSSNYPTSTGAYDEVYSGSGVDGRGSAGDTDVFVSKFDQAGNLLWSTFLGGFNYDRAYAVEVGPNDDVFVGGRAGAGFPTTTGVLQEAFAGDDNANNLYGEQDAFITRLAADGGSLVWSTFVGESGQGIIREIDVDAAGNVYFAFTGATGDLPQPQAFGPHQLRQGWDGFYGKLSADGKTLLFGDYMGGSGSGTQDGREPSVRVTPDGQVYYLTWTDKSDFGCITNGSFDTTHNGGVDLVLAHFDEHNTLDWCTFIGGSGDEFVETHGLTVDAAGNAVIGVDTTSDDMPTTQGVFQPDAGGDTDGYLAVISPAGELLHGSYFGGSGADWIEGIAVADNGDIVFSGGTENSPDCPFVGDQFKSSVQGREGLVVRVSADLGTLLFSSPYGGSARDEFRGIAANAAGEVAIVGLTESSDFPTVNAFDTTLDPDSGADQGVVYLILAASYEP